MESPGLTWIPTGAGNLSYLVAHETAHQWFYGIVGNDQARNPYADEAAADMVARNVLGLRRASRCASARLDLTIYRYSSACYYEVVYIQGGNFLDDVRRSMGTSAYWTAMRRYVADNRFGLSSTRRLLEALDAATKLDLRTRYHARFPSLY
jgi:aminopeptidase N